MLNLQGWLEIDSNIFLFDISIMKKDAVVFQPITHSIFWSIDWLEIIFGTVVFNLALVSHQYSSSYSKTRLENGLFTPSTPTRVFDLYELKGNESICGINSESSSRRHFLSVSERCLIT